jgi:hypothetical protein
MLVPMAKRRITKPWPFLRARRLSFEASFNLAAGNLIALQLVYIDMVTAAGVANRDDEHAFWN